MKIVIIAEAIYPRIAPRSFRATELALQLGRLGHEVILYASLGSYNYERDETFKSVKVKDLGTSIFSVRNSDGIIDVPLWNKGLVYFLRKPLNFPDIMLAPLTKKAILSEGIIDLLITIAVPYPIHWGASWLDRKEVNFKTWISDCGDPFMKSESSKPYGYFKYLEKRWGRRTDFITVPVEEAKRGYYEEFREKIRVIPQGFDFEKVETEAYIRNEVPTFIYAGLFYPEKRDPTNFLNYLVELERDFKFVVFTNKDTLLKKFTDKLGSKLRIKTPVARLKLIKQLSKADFLINIKNEGTGVQVPSKLIDYSLSGRPFLSITSRFDETEKNCFNLFLNRDYSAKDSVEDLGQYDIRNVANRFLSLHEEHID